MRTTRRRYTTPFIILLPGLLSLAPGTASAAPAGSSTWALLVGIGKFQSSFISQLKYPAVDATAIRDALVDPQVGSVPADHVLLLTDAKGTKDAIFGAVDTFLKPNVKPGDEVIVYLASHGVCKGVGLDARSYLLSTDVRNVTSAALEASAVNLRELSTRLGALPASQFVLFVDACREDPTPGRGLKPNSLTDVLSQSAVVVPDNAAGSANPPRSVTFFACDVGQRAYEDDDKRHGIFTASILDALSQRASQQSSQAVEVSMDRLAGFVEKSVSQWAQQNEVDQTPVAVTPSQDQAPVVLLRVKRPLDLSASAAVMPRVLATARSVGGPTSSDPQAQELFSKAQRAESRQEWEVAEATYGLATDRDPHFVGAYERLAELQRRQGHYADSLATLIKMTGQAPADPHIRAHVYSLLTRGYATYNEKGPGDQASDVSASGFNGFSMPRKQADAAGLSLRAANEALKADSGSDEAQLAKGFALVATDDKGKNSRDALTAFGKAVALDDTGAVNHFGYGYGLRFFSMFLKDAEAKDQLNRAVTELQQALKLLPEYYDAHRELAYCYHLLDRSGEAKTEYQMAAANRGATGDKDEVAGEHVALAAIYKEDADRNRGKPQSQNLNAASEGYADDATQITPNLQKALMLMANIGLRSRLIDHLPPEARQIMQGIQDPRGAIRNRVEDTIRRRIPGLGGLRLP